MTDYDQVKIADLARIGKDKTLSAKERGDALEDLFCYLLEGLGGVRIRRNAIDRFKSQEIDIAVANKGEGWLGTFPRVFFVECKNWDARVSPTEVTNFFVKLFSASVELGIIVAANGITGNRKELLGAYHTIAIAQAASRIRILVVTLDQLLAVKTVGEFEDLLTDCLLECVSSANPS